MTGADGWRQAPVATRSLGITRVARYHVEVRAAAAGVGYACCSSESHRRRAYERQRELGAGRDIFEGVVAAGHAWDAY